MEQEIAALLRARNTLLWIVSKEEQRVKTLIVQAAATARSRVLFWACDVGITALDGTVVSADQDPQAALATMRKTRDRIVFVLCDLHKWLGDPVTLRSLKSLAQELQASPQSEARSLIVLTTSNEVPAELPSATVLDWPLPNRTEVGALFDDVMSSVDASIQEASAVLRDKSIDAAVGLTTEEAANCFAKSIVKSRRVDPVLVIGEKKKVISRERVLEWFDPDPRGLDGIGGNALAKEWLIKRLTAFSPEAREFGLPAPKGMMMVGVSGCGKSLTAKCVAAAWQMPLLRLDMGALKSKFVGESEQNIRKALRVAEAVAPCVLWLDEIEKSLAGASGPQGDGGVGADALGTVLNWMQERAGAVFVIATANDVSGLPPELLRKGRFDEMFFVDLPTTVERGEILAATLLQFDRDAGNIDLAAMARSTNGFTGAEIASLVPEALYEAFNDGRRPITTEDLQEAAEQVVPLSKTAAEKIQALRDWAKGRARPTSLPEVTAPAGFRKIDI